MLWGNPPKTYQVSFMFVINDNSWAFWKTTKIISTICYQHLIMSGYLRLQLSLITEVIMWLLTIAHSNLFTITVFLSNVFLARARCLSIHRDRLPLMSHEENNCMNLNVCAHIHETLPLLFLKHILATS